MYTSDNNPFNLLAKLLALTLKKKPVEVQPLESKEDKSFAHRIALDLRILNWLYRQEYSFKQQLCGEIAAQPYIPVKIQVIQVRYAYRISDMKHLQYALNWSAKESARKNVRSLFKFR